MSHLELESGILNHDQVMGRITFQQVRREML